MEEFRKLSPTRAMVRRTVTALILLALVLPAIYFGGLLYFVYLGFFVVASAWEYVHFFQVAAYQPSTVAVVGGSMLILLARGYLPAAASPALVALVLAALTLHLVAYERGRDQAALDFGITVGGIIYLGWIAAYMLDLRALPAGGWWTLLIFGVVWLADSSAYFVGVKYGRHKIAPRLSPRKSWEGYVAGAIVGPLAGGLFAFGLAQLGFLHVTIWQGMLLGLVLGAVTTLGDLGESLFKRFANVKDSGSFLPGHGGAFDRIDSLIWAAVIGFYWIRFFQM